MHTTHTPRTSGTPRAPRAPRTPRTPRTLRTTRTPHTPHTTPHTPHTTRSFTTHTPRSQHLHQFTHNLAITKRTHTLSITAPTKQNYNIIANPNSYVRTLLTQQTDIQDEKVRVRWSEPEPLDFEKFESFGIDSRACSVSLAHVNFGAIQRRLHENKLYQDYKLSDPLNVLRYIF